VRYDLVGGIAIANAVMLSPIKLLWSLVPGKYMLVLFMYRKSARLRQRYIKYLEETNDARSALNYMKSNSSHSVIITIYTNTISFVQGTYTYIPETNRVPKEYNIAAILMLHFMAPIPLVSALALMYFYFSIFRSMCAVPIWQFSVVP
jgi:hypothetical protein